MDVCEAFCVAVKLYRSGEWSLSLPARNTINLDGNEFTLRHVCSLVEHNKHIGGEEFASLLTEWLSP